MGYSTSGEFTNAERTKLTNIEALADVTDTANVDAANAVMDADFSGAVGFMEKASAGVYDLITSQELNADIIDLIRPLHPNVSMLAAMDDATLANIYKPIDDYILGISGGNNQFFLDSDPDSTGSTTPIVTATYTLSSDKFGVWVHEQLRTQYGAYPARSWYRVNGGTWISIYSTNSVSFVSTSKYVGDLSNGDVFEFGLDTPQAAHTAYSDEHELKDSTNLTGNVVSDAIAANVAVLSFFSHMKGKFINGVGNTHALPVGVEIYGNGDSYAAALNATTKFKIDVADPRIELYRIDDSVVAKSNDQTDWVLDDNVTNGAFPTKTTSTHETILAEEIGCASVVMVEKSVNGAFTDTEILVEDDDYTVDYSTRTATKIILTSAEASDIVISQSKLRITWIADVEDIEGTANTALKMKIYLNRTANNEASPEIQKIDIGTDKYAEMQYLCG